jgi:hypothetical protein
MRMVVEIKSYRHEKSKREWEFMLAVVGWHCGAVHPSLRMTTTFTTSDDADNRLDTSKLRDLAQQKLVEHLISVSVLIHSNFPM